MQIDRHGHILIRPKELLEIAVEQPRRLINDILIPGTPAAFPNYARYGDFVDWIGNVLGVNPRCILLRGSSKVGFSIAPKPGKAWCELRDDSDIDLAIVDPDYYHAIDREVRHWETQPENVAAIFQSPELAKQFQRRQSERQHYRYRDYNLPDGLQNKTTISACTQDCPIAEACGFARTVNLFVYRDWMSLVARYVYDIQELTSKISWGEIPRAAHHLRPAQLSGVWQTWHSNRQLAWECTYQDGAPQGRWQSWHPNGQLQSEGDYEGDKSEGSRVGEWTWYREDGTVRAKGTYLKDKERNGTFKQWDRKSDSCLRIRYDNGRKHYPSIVTF